MSIRCTNGFELALHMCLTGPLPASLTPTPARLPLDPPGEYNLRLGVMKELQPELIATHQGDVRVFEGHAFIVEAAVSLGGKDIKQVGPAAGACCGPGLSWPPGSMHATLLG